MTAWALAPVLRSWQRRFPAVELDLAEYASADQMLAVLRDGGTDIAVGPRPTRTEEHTEVLGREEIVVVAAPHDDLLRRFAADLKRRGLPDSRLPTPPAAVPEGKQQWA